MNPSPRMSSRSTIPSRWRLTRWWLCWRGSDPRRAGPHSEGSAMRPPRFRLRTLLVVVAMVAGILGGVRALQLTFLETYYRERARLDRSMAAGLRADASDPRTPPRLADKIRVYAESLERSARRFESAARP